MALETPADVRSFLVDELRRDLVGPGAEDEVLDDRPTTHYLTGILYPSASTIDPEEDDDLAAPDADDDFDPGNLVARSMNPATIGLTFSCEPLARILVRVRAARYLEVLPTGEQKRSKWQRVAVVPDAFVVEGRGEVQRFNIEEGLEIYVRWRQRQGTAVVTVSLINNHVASQADMGDDGRCFFQPVIEVTGEHPGEAPFNVHGHRTEGPTDPDRLLNELLYRHAREFAVGHGCAAEWETADQTHATLLRTVVVPGYEIRQLSPDHDPSLPAQGMRFLAQAGVSELVSELEKLISQYRSWVKAVATNIASVPEHLASRARSNLDECRHVADRMEKTIDLIRTRDDVRIAFQLANEAMLMQRARVEWLKKPPGERTNMPQLDDSHRWRQFQLAFMLLAISGLANPEDPDRGTVDLLWFPTGGGKTEAYLGLTAFTIFFRRLRAGGSHEGSGVTVLMRYTLRLLTIQQFQRAASLIMSCEKIRRGREDLGAEPISLGLWVGGGSTPNTRKEAASALRLLGRGESVTEGNPVQISVCPWCGTELDPGDYMVSDRMHIRCSNRGCEYHRDLPLFLIDEDIYDFRPSLLLGTVDKFARLPWSEESAALFGRRGQHVPPPELIIQDELHLISGPLGTLVGLYEVAVDMLCTHQGVPPKVIASTATIRRAEEQVKSLFNRALCQFPPPALDARDTYFAKEVSAEVKPGRLYVGVYAPGRSMKTALLRIYANLLQKCVEAPVADRATRDPYTTLVGYFNSLRELGGAVRLVEDDVRARIEVLAGRNDGTAPPRTDLNSEELTSRVSSNRIEGILRLMATPGGEPGALDTLLATNMISVGVDVDRLGLMVVNGQPKMTSEYIQATSRVGRKYPGLVITLFNWSRPRDRSHYERFVGYHSSIYSQVEATSVTPFAGRARDRALPAVFISLVRHLASGMSTDTAAGDFTPENARVQEIVEWIRSRVHSVDGPESEETGTQLDEIITRWEQMANPSLTYSKGNERLLLQAEKVQSNSGRGFSTMNSMRGVEGEAGLFFVGRKAFRNAR